MQASWVRRPDQVGSGVVGYGRLRHDVLAIPGVGRQDTKVRAICDQIPLKRLGRPDEVAAFITFMASDECSYATGATFDVNGGLIML